MYLKFNDQFDFSEVAHDEFSLIQIPNYKTIISIVITVAFSNIDIIIIVIVTVTVY
jgi:hypothetical protein